MKLLNNQAGITLIETIVSITMLSLSTLIIFSAIANQEREKANSDNVVKLMEFIELHNFELTTKALKHLPDAGDCYFRIYSLATNELISSGRDFAIGSSECDSTDFSQTQETSIVKVVVQSETVDSTILSSSINFSDDKFMKVTPTAEQIRDVMIYGTIKIGNYEKTLNSNTFKR